MNLFGEPSVSAPSVGDLVPGNITAPGPIVFEEDGELRLEVGPERTPMIVCPKALARASPVFKRMLFGGFAESKPADGEWVVRLPEEDPEGFSIILNIIHGNVHVVPKSLGYCSFWQQHGKVASNKLYDVVVAADKYDLVRILSPWADRWLRNACKRVHCSTFGNTGRRPNWDGCSITVAWVLGDESLLGLELDQVVLSIHTWSGQECRQIASSHGVVSNDTSNGQGSDKENIHYLPVTDDEVDVAQNIAQDVDARGHDLCMKDVFDEHMPLYSSTRPENDILSFIGLEMLETTRIEVITGMLGPLKSFLETFLARAAETEHVVCHQSWRYSWTGPPKTLARVLEQMTDTLCQVGLYPLPEPESYPRTIDDLYDELQTARSDPRHPRHYLVPGNYEPPNCGSCPACLGHNEMNKAMEEMEQAIEKRFYNRPFMSLDSSQRSHLLRGKQESGIRGGLPSDLEWECFSSWNG